VVPTIVATLAFAWWFRSSNSSARYRPDFIYSGQIELVTWSIPLMTIMLLGGVAWRGSHDLDPARPLPSDEAPLKVQAVSLDWKWLFIYPDHNIATVNRLVIPVGAPVHFTLTSASVMNAFFVPKLGSMIYTMNRMETQLHLNADQPGTFLGMSSHFSGDGFADMQFNVRGVAEGRVLCLDRRDPQRRHRDSHLANYQDLAKQSMKVAPFAYSAVEPDLFHKVVTQALPPGPGPIVETSPGASKRGRNSMLGKLTWAAVPLDQPIPLLAGCVAFGIVGGIAVYVVLKGWAPYLWREWITSVDHKRIGVMYIFLAMVMLLRGFTDAIMMRSQQALAFRAPGYLPPEHYDQIFSAHGTLMILFVAMPFMIGLINIVVPLQLGVRDVAFPTLNSVSFWLTATGALLINLSLVIGEFARTGWLPYPPLSELDYSPGVGVDYYLWSLQISGVGTLLTGVNFVTTILKIRAPGMTYMRMPIFCWTALASSLLIVAAFPILTATLGHAAPGSLPRLSLLHQRSRRQSMMFMNLIWAWGHPEVYILVLPAFGVFSEVVSTLSGKPLFGYRSMVACDDGHLRPRLHGLAASFLHHGGRRQRERVLRHHDDDHRGADGRERCSTGCSPCTAAASAMRRRCCGRSASSSPSSSAE
jgi:cytochrome o ubiquinol oxidase subunit II